ncbi:Flavanone 7-O-glucoside 2''-O-beta-L-rhamnosyltransferase [Triticum urartu]|uniref:Flavanone 7-O-glucoside 2''-O-beta-L-rhamnosyltransferase n=1 Tax=Triticum urartu TaxID=4572 RepID=M8A5S9_TRIUA|nr:Flavanone 7-O-glucoside 2''-O-beta-L-rhamnosyltransferase [Triticum urartu]
MAQAERECMRVVMFPWLAHGHINPYLELAKRLVAASPDDHLDVVVHLVSTPANLAPLAHHQTDRIRLVELHLPALPGLPPALHTTKGLPAHLMPALKRACDLAAPRFGALLDQLCPDIVVYDFLQPWAPLEAAARGVPAVHFNTFSAAAKAFVVHCLKTERAPSAFPFETISLGGADEDAKYTARLISRDDGTAMIPERDRLPLSLERSSGFVAIKTCADIERKYVDYLSQLVGKEVVPTGPLLVDSGGSEAKRDGGRIMRWLDGKEPGSVVLVSFGSEYFMSDRQMAQMARGLELSRVPYLWVVRFPNAEDDARGAARSMPRGFKPARGLVVEGWAPQWRILSHRSCGAFLTHCGWSSVLESMASGVPKRFGEFKAEDVARAVRSAVNGRERVAARRRARELREVVARNNGDDRQIATLLQRMARLCGKGQAVPN